ncbi:MAG: metallophosphoesterase family protein [Bacteroidetes bacterium]|nr:metallophosphoesterase family protein [Bacteroidota bacterium]MBM3423909.1 metallophosphoesterase family protein [Bacteroidota bacterium]
MRIALLSDTHGDLLCDVLPYLQDVNEIWHAGDIGSLSVIDQLSKIKPCRFVYGNIDDAKIRRTVPDFQVFEIDGLKILMTHIGGRPGKVPAGVNDRIKREKPDLFICGHSHLALVQFDARSQLLWMNPGSCGIKGFHKIRTLFRFSILDRKCTKFEVIELPRYPSQSVSQESAL